MRKLTSRCCAALLTCACHVLLGACSKLVESGIDYAPCVEPALPYLEEFREGEQWLRDRCWSFDHARPQQGSEMGHSDLLIDDGDLLLRPRAAISWRQAEPAVDAAEPAPLVYRRISGDFLVAARVEATSGIDPDHCLGANDAAGLAVRRPDDDSAWATFTIRPTSVAHPECGDDAADPAQITASAAVASAGFTASTSGAKDGIGEDAEVDIAVCRLHGKLFYYYRDVKVDYVSFPDQAWKFVPEAMTTVGDGPLDVGATAIGDDVKGLEAHVNWMVFQAAGTLGSDSCQGALEALTSPLPEGD